MQLALQNFWLPSRRIYNPVAYRPRRRKQSLWDRLQLPIFHIGESGKQLLTQAGKIVLNAAGQRVLCGECQCRYERVFRSATITRSGGIATVTVSGGHGLIRPSPAVCFSGTGVGSQFVRIEGADQPEYNKNASVAVGDIISSTQFTYGVSGSPATPATGSIVMRRGAAPIQFICGTAGFGCLVPGPSTCVPFYFTLKFKDVQISQGCRDTTAVDCEDPQCGQCTDEEDSVTMPTSESLNGPTTFSGEFLVKQNSFVQNCGPSYSVGPTSCNGTFYALGNSYTSDTATGDWEGKKYQRSSTCEDSPGDEDEGTLDDPYVVDDGISAGVGYSLTSCSGGTFQRSVGLTLGGKLVFQATENVTASVESSTLENSLDPDTQCYAWGSGGTVEIIAC